jgi:hypothetical protein
MDRLPKHKRVIELITNHSELRPDISFQPIENPFFDDHIAHYENYIDHVLAKCDNKSAAIGFSYQADEYGDNIYTAYRITFKNKYKFCRNINQLIPALNDAFSFDLPDDAPEVIPIIKNIVPIRETQGINVRASIEALIGKKKYYNRKKDNTRRYEFVGYQLESLTPDLISLYNSIRESIPSFTMVVHKNGYLVTTFEEV